MAQMDSLDALFEQELRDIYDAEKQLTKALPKLAKKATAEQLKDAFTEHLQQTEEHVDRLEQVFELLDRPAKTKKCEGMKNLIAEGDEMIVFDAVTHLAKARMIDVLLPSLGVAPGCLDMPFRIGTNPYLGPCRRNHQRAQAIPGARVDRGAVGPRITKALARPLAPDPGTGVRYVAQAGGLGGVARVDDGLHGCAGIEQAEVLGRSPDNCAARCLFHVGFEAGKCQHALKQKRMARGPSRQSGASTL